MSGGLDDALNNILNLCNEQNIPFVFALGRRALGRACAKLVPVSVVGIFNYSGTEVSLQMTLTQTFQTWKVKDTSLSNIFKVFNKIFSECKI